MLYDMVVNVLEGRRKSTPSLSYSVWVNVELMPFLCYIVLPCQSSNLSSVAFIWLPDHIEFSLADLGGGQVGRGC